MPDLDRALTDMRAVLRGVSETSMVEVVACTTLLVGADWTAQIRGGTVPAFWVGSAIPRHGAAGIALLMKYPNGSQVAWVLGTTAATPPNGEIGTVGTVSTNTALITINSTVLTAQRVSTYTPIAGDIALVTWAAGIPYLLGKVVPPTPVSVGVVPPVPPSPPSPVITDTTLFPMSDSGTWLASSGWSASLGNNLFTGSAYTSAASGNVFYAGRTRGLADKTAVSRVQFWLGAMLPADSGSGSDVVVHFYAHSANDRGTTEPARVAGPYNVTVPAGWGGGYLDLPASVGTPLQTGGGITLYGDPSVGFACGAADINAGALLVTWSK